MSAPRKPGSSDSCRADAAGSPEPPVIAPRSSPDRGLPRKEILRRRGDVARVMRTGMKLAGLSVYVRYARNPDPVATGRRVAFLLPRQIRRAVDRNRLKRRMREAYRRNKERFPAGNDYLFHMTPGSQSLGLKQLEELTCSIAARIHVDGATA